MAAAVEYKIGTRVTYLVTVVDPNGNLIQNLPPETLVTVTSSDPSTVLVLLDGSNQFQFDILCSMPGSTVITVKVAGGALDSTNTIAIAVLGEVPGPDKEAAALRAASVVIEPTGSAPITIEPAPVK